MGILIAVPSFSDLIMGCVVLLMYTDLYFASPRKLRRKADGASFFSRTYLHKLHLRTFKVGSFQQYNLPSYQPSLSLTFSRGVSQPFSVVDWLYLNTKLGMGLLLRLLLLLHTTTTDSTITTVLNITTTTTTTSTGFATTTK